jgi:hypothetical protein
MACDLGFFANRDTVLLLLLLDLTFAVVLFRWTVVDISVMVIESLSAICTISVAYDTKKMKCIF